MESDNNQILENKMKGYEKQMQKIKEYLKDNSVEKYNIIEANYKKYVELNGVLHSKSPLALEVRDKNARYFYVEKDNEIIDDFAIYNDENWITVDRFKYKDLNYINQIFDFLKEDYDYVVEYMPLEMINLIHIIESNFEVESEIITQGGFEYKRYKIYLNK